MKSTPQTQEEKGAQPSPKIYFRQSTGSTYEFDYSPADKLASLIEKIYHFHLSESDTVYPSIARIDLIYKGKTIDKDSQLGDVPKMEPNSIIHIFFKPAEPDPAKDEEIKWVFVSHEGSIYKIEFQATESRAISVDYLMDKIQDIDEISLDRQLQILLFQSKQLMQGTLLTDYLIKNGDLLSLAKYEIKRDIVIDFPQKSHLNPRLTRGKSEERERSVNEGNSEDADSYAEQIRTTSKKGLKKGTQSLFLQYDELQGKVVEDSSQNPSDYACVTPMTENQFDFQDHQWFITEQKDGEATEPLWITSENGGFNPNLCNQLMSPPQDLLMQNFFTDLAEQQIVLCESMSYEDAISVTASQSASAIAKGKSKPKIAERIEEQQQGDQCTDSRTYKSQSYVKLVDIKSTKSYSLKYQKSNVEDIVQLKATILDLITLIDPDLLEKPLSSTQGSQSPIYFYQQPEDPEGEWSQIGEDKAIQILHHCLEQQGSQPSAGSLSASRKKKSLGFRLGIGESAACESKTAST